MKQHPALSAMISSALLLSACGSRTPTLPTDPIDKAATCGAIAAIEARSATPDVKASLPFAAQGRILHFALLAGVGEGGDFSNDAASAVNARMPAIGKTIVSEKWQALVEPCHSAFPQAQISRPALPADPNEARLGCDALGEFIVRAMASEDKDYGNELAEYRKLSAALDQSPMVKALRQRAGSDLEKQQQLRRKALAKLVLAGSPMAVMNQCIARYG